MGGVRGVLCLLPIEDRVALNWRGSWKLPRQNKSSLVTRPKSRRRYGRVSSWRCAGAEAVNHFETVGSWFHWVGVSSSGLLIHAACGSGGGVGGLRTNRSGWVW